MKCSNACCTRFGTARGLGAGAAAARPTAAKDYPNRPVRLMVPNAPGQLGRYPEPHRRDEPVGRARPAGRPRQPRGRRRRHRDGNRQGRHARRLYADQRNDRGLDDREAAPEEPDVPPGARLRLCRGVRRNAERAGRQSFSAGEVGEGADRVRESQAERFQDGFRRQRLAEPHVRARTSCRRRTSSRCTCLTRAAGRRSPRWSAANRTGRSRRPRR